MKTGVELIAEERQRQIEEEGWTAQHDANHDNEELAKAAACYATPAPEREIWAGNESLMGKLQTKTILSVLWPWTILSWKPTHDRIRELQKAGALIAAEIDRLNRKS